MSLLDPKLVAFMAIVKHKTVHSAAWSLSLTQTAVTQRIRALETRLRTTLFIRSRRGVALTPEGEALLRYCNASKALEGEALATIQGAATAIDISLCVTGPTSLMRSRVIPQCMQAAAQFPKLLLHFDINDAENRHQTLRAGLCDIAILSEEQIADEMQTKKLKPEQYVLVCSPLWHERTLADIVSTEYIVDFDPSDQMTFHYLKQHKLFDKAKYPRHFVNRPESLADMISRGMGYGVLSKEFAQCFIDNKELIPLNQGKTLNFTPLLAWYPRPEPPRYFTALIDAIQ